MPGNEISTLLKLCIFDFHLVTKFSKLIPANELLCCHAINVFSFCYQGHKSLASPAQLRIFVILVHFIQPLMKSDFELWSQFLVRYFFCFSSFSCFRLSSLRVNRMKDFTHSFGSSSSRLSTCRNISSSSASLRSISLGFSHG